MKTPGHWERFTIKTALLWPLSKLYSIGVWIDRETSPKHIAPISVISVGNATAGGAGKTPVTLALVQQLKALGHTPHVLTRGYKSHAPLNAHRVTDTDTAVTVGDEAMLLARAAPTWVGRDRFASACAAADAGATVVVCDDAHQHYRLQKTFSLLVVDGPFAFGNQQLIPAGPLREPLWRAFSRTDAVVVIGEDPHDLAQRITLPVFSATLTPDVDAASMRRTNYVAFAGIGRPEKFFDTLRGMGLTLAATHALPDHHTYSAAELETLGAQAKTLGARLITTEKDAVKLPAAMRSEITILPVTLTFANEKAFTDLLSASLPL